MGYLLNILFVVHVRRGSENIGIISDRKADRQEINQDYEGSTSAPPISANNSNACAVTSLANERLKRNREGAVVLKLKSPYRDGTTHIVMSPLDKIAGSDFEQPKVGPKGGGQDTRSNSCNTWPL